MPILEVENLVKHFPKRGGLFNGVIANVHALNGVTFHVEPGETLGVVVGNHTSELDELREHPRVYFAEGEHAWGVVEGLDHYDFLGQIRIPEEEPA